MFGRVIKKHCPVCNKEIQINISVGYKVDGKNYYPNCFCQTCETDLSKEDREILNSAEKNGKSIGVMMF